MDLHSIVLRALEQSGISAPPEPLVALLRGNVSAAPTSHHIAQHAKTRVQERATDGARFAALHDDLRAKGVRDLDRLTIFLQRISDEKAVLQMLRTDAAGTSATAGSTAAVAMSSNFGAPTRPPTSEGLLPAAPRAFALPQLPAVSWESGWLLSRPYLSGGYLAAGVREQLAGATGGNEYGSSSLAALPVAQQEEVLVTDLLCVLVGVEGRYVRAATAAAQTASASLDDHGLSSSRSSHAAAMARVRFALPAAPAPASTKSGSGVSGAGGAGGGGLDPSLRELALQLLPLGERYLALSRYVHARSVSLESGQVLHAFCAALRSCLQEHMVGVAQLEQHQRTRGLSLQQLCYFVQPAGRSLATLDALVEAIGHTRGGALLRALHAQRQTLAGDVEGAELLQYMLDRTAAPFLEMLALWVHQGQCRDPFGEFMVVERPEEARDDLTTDFNCQYWQRRFTLAPAQVPAFLEEHAAMILTTGKSLHVIRECGKRLPEPGDAGVGAGGRGLSLGGGGSGGAAASAFPLEERALATRLKAASEWATSQLVALLMGEHALLERLASVKHYFLLDQGDFFVHFLDSAEDELTKPVGDISRARLQSKLELALRQSAVADPYRDSLTCDLLPYNLTNQLLRIINASKSTAPPPPQAASRTPGLDAFTFDYAVGWPLSLLLSKHALTKYQLLFRHLFHCKHVERQLSASWLSQQEPKQLVGTAAAFTASFGLRQRMLHFLFNMQHYMMFEVLEPNWHMLQQKLRAARSLDTLLTHHGEFLDVSLRQCMLRDAVLLKLLAKLLTICVIFADQTRIVMSDVAHHLAASPRPPCGAARRTWLRELSSTVTATVDDMRYHQNVVKLAAKFDEELKQLLDELRRQSQREWNLNHLCARLDYNSYWASPSHASIGPAASLSAAAAQARQEGAAGTAPPAGASSSRTAT